MNVTGNTHVNTHAAAPKITATAASSFACGRSMSRSPDGETNPPNTSTIRMLRTQ
jgi:hypothetical protein